MNQKAVEFYFRESKILAVDDFEKWLNVVKNNAEYCGVKEKNIFLASNIEEGKRIYSLEKPDIVVSDINFDGDNLENKDGLKFISYINKRAHRDYKGMTRTFSFDLLAMSSLESEIVNEAISAGANYFINKKEFTKDWDLFVEKSMQKKRDLEEWVSHGTGPLSHDRYFLTGN